MLWSKHSVPVLDNARHEAFAHALVKGMSADEAYQQAGFKPNRGNASRLKANESIAARVAELQQMTADRIVVDREWVMAKLVENAGCDNPSARNKALELIGKELGMFVDRTENVNTNYNIADEPMSDSEWTDEHTTH